MEDEGKTIVIREMDCMNWVKEKESEVEKDGNGEVSKEASFTKKPRSGASDFIEESDIIKSKDKDKNRENRKLSKQDRIELSRLFQGAVTAQDWCNLPEKWCNLLEKWYNLPSKWCNLPSKWCNLLSKWCNLPSNN